MLCESNVCERLCWTARLSVETPATTFGSHAVFKTAAPVAVRRLSSAQRQGVARARHGRAYRPLQVGRSLWSRDRTTIVVNGSATERRLRGQAERKLQKIAQKQAENRTRGRGALFSYGAILSENCPSPRPFSSISVSSQLYIAAISLMPNFRNRISIAASRQKMTQKTGRFSLFSATRLLKPLRGLTIRAVRDPTSRHRHSVPTRCLGDRAVKTRAAASRGKPGRTPRPCNGHNRAVRLTRYFTKMTEMSLSMMVLNAVCSLLCR